MNVEIRDLVPGGSVNVRRTNQKDRIESLAASIEATGILQPLAVEDMGNKYRVVDGNRRLAALALLVEREIYTEDRTVPVHVLDATQVNGLEASLAANFHHLPLHPVDQYEAFAELASGGMDSLQIAAHFGTTKQHIEQQMALGGLHPDIRAAWREGKIDAEAARAFCLSRDQKEQIAVFKRLQKQGHGMWAGSVRRAFGLDANASIALAIVGEEAYRAAGGKVSQNLFDSTEYIVSDVELAGKMLRDKLLEKCTELTEKEGWGFAYLVSDVKDSWKWRHSGSPEDMKLTKDEKAELKTLRARMKEIDAESDDAEGELLEKLTDEQEAVEKRIEEIEEQGAIRAWTPDKRKKAGCLVSAGAGGISVEYGCRKPGEAKKAATQRGTAGDDAASAPEPAKISNTMIAELSERRTFAVARTLAKEPTLIISTLTAALMAHAAGEAAPLKIDLGGPSVCSPLLAPEREAEQPLTFAAALEKVSGMKSLEVLDTLARLVASTVDLRERMGWSECPADASQALLDLLDPKSFESEALKVFEAERYFNGVPAALCKAALEDMGVDLSKHPAATKKKDLASMATSKAIATGWLPDRMRIRPRATV